MKRVHPVLFTISVMLNLALILLLLISFVVGTGEIAMVSFSMTDESPDKTQEAIIDGSYRVRPDGDLNDQNDRIIDGMIDLELGFSDGSQGYVEISIPSYEHLDGNHQSGWSEDSSHYFVVTPRYKATFELLRHIEPEHPPKL